MAPGPGSRSPYRARLRAVGGRTLWRVWVPALVLFFVLLTGIANQVVRAEAAGRQDLRDRFALRTALAGQFTEAFVAEIRARELVQARRWLSGAVSPAKFGQVSGGFGFDASVLLNAKGRVIAIYPPKPAVVGSEVASKYPHLRAAIDGRQALSPVVLSIAAHGPVVASVIPFPTRHGRRVFSGGFLIAKTPLGAYLRNASAIPGAAFAIIDSSNKLVVRSTGVVSAAANDALRGRVSRPGLFVVEKPIAGTSWTVVSVVPTLRLYGPIGHRFLLSWIILAAFAAASLAALVLLYGLMIRNDELLELSTSDPLTGLWNRRALEVSYRQRLAHGARYGNQGGALLVLDIDDFKEVNDRLGHAAGDALLVHVADTLRETLRGSDIIARLGGDEFAILLPDATLASASLVMRKVEGALRAIGLRDPAFAGLEIRASVGLALETDATTSLDAILSTADAAMYRAKPLRTHRPQSAPIEARTSPGRPVLGRAR